MPSVRLGFRRGTKFLCFSNPFVLGPRNLRYGREKLRDKKERKEVGMMEIAGMGQDRLLVVFSVVYCLEKKGHLTLGAIFEMAGPGSAVHGQNHGDVHDLCRPGKGCKRRVKRYKEKRMAPTRYANTNAADTGWVVLFRSTYSPFSPLSGPHLARRTSIQIRLILSIDNPERS